jgi:transcription elongation factor Elf1
MRSRLWVMAERDMREELRAVIAGKVGSPTRHTFTCLRCGSLALGIADGRQPPLACANCGGTAWQLSTPKPARAAV